MTTDTNRATPTKNTEPVATTKEEQIVQQQLAQATSMQRQQLAPSTECAATTVGTNRATTVINTESTATKTKGGGTKRAAMRRGH